jgi:uncharacterized protein (TIGR02466 family)
MSTINTEYIFPTPYWWVDITDLDNDKMLEACYELERNQNERIASNLGGYQSDDLSHDHPAFIDLLNHIQTISQTIFEEAYTKFYNSPYKSAGVSNYWCNINRKNHLNLNHIHPGSFLSAVYYVSADSELYQGDIIFRRDYSWIMNHGGYFNNLKGKECPAYLEQQVSLSPRTGALMLFPAYLPHSVDPNKSDTDRVSIAFNIMLKES